MRGKPPVRYSIVLLALVINMVCYTDRVCIAVAGPEMSSAFHFSPSQMGLVYSIFSLSYFLGQTPWGIVSDRVGSRGIVSFAVAGWSVFTALTGFAWNFVSLLAIRFTFGGLESALSPAVASAFSRWIPVSERSTAFGAFLGGGRLGAAIAPPIIGFVMLHYGWRVPFVLFGAIGLVWSALWFRWYTNNPEAHPSISETELRVIRAGAPAGKSAAVETKWNELLRSSRLWCLLAVAFGYTFLWQFFITWFPTYLREHRGLSLAETSFYAGIPFLAGVAATWIGGGLTDFIGARTNPRFARTVVGLFALVSAAGLMSIGIWSPGAGTAALAMGLAAGAGDLYLGAAWSSATDIGGGAVAGLMNAASNCAGFASPALMGWVLQKSGNWDSVLLLSVAMTCIAAVLWLFVNPRVKAVPVESWA